MSNVDSRAVSMIMYYNDVGTCEHCQEGMLYVQATDNLWIVANVYADCEDPSDSCKRCRGGGRRWDHVEHWHMHCYADRGNPYGEAVFKKTTRKAKKDVNKD